MFTKFRHIAAFVLLVVFTSYQFASYLHLNEHHQEETQKHAGDHDTDDHNDATECDFCKTFFDQEYTEYQKTFIPVFRKRILFEIIHHKVLVQQSEFYANLRAPPSSKV